MDGDEADTWVPPKTSEEEAIERSRKTAVLDTKRWIEEICEKKFADESDFRGSLRDGILLCEVLNKLKTGCVKRINRRRTPIAGLDNLSVFLAALEKDFGFSKAQLFDVKDLEDISEKYEGDAYAVEDLTRALRVALTLCGLSQPSVTCDSPGVSSVKPIDSTLFISGTVIHRRQSLALSTSDSDSLAGSGYLASGMPVRHNYDAPAVGGTSFDGLDDSRASSAISAAGTSVGGGPVRFQKRDAADLTREAQRQMEVARMNRSLASTVRPVENNEDEWRSNLSDWREKRRRQNQNRTPSLDPSLDQLPEKKKEEATPENPKPFKKMVEESNKRRRSYNLLYPVEDEEPIVVNIDIPDATSTVKPKEEFSSKNTPSSTSYPESAPWAMSDIEQTIAPHRTVAVKSTPPPSANDISLRQGDRESNGRSAQRYSRTSETSSSDGEALQRSAAVKQRTTTIRLTRRGHRVEQHFGVHLSEKGGAIVVDRVVRGSTADVNEVRVGDKVVSIDGRPVTSLEDAEQWLSRESAQLCVQRNSCDEDEFSEEMSDDESVEMRHPVRRELSNRRSAPCMNNKETRNEPGARVSDGPPANLPPLRRVSSSSSTSAPPAEELQQLGSQQETPMINGLLRAARKGELPLDLRSSREDRDEDDDRTPTAEGGDTSKTILSVRQRISTIESRNNFFGVKADSEEKKYKELEQSSQSSSRPSSRPVSGDETSLDRPTASQTLPWQRKQEFRPIRPRLGHYQKPTGDETESKSAPKTPELSSSAEADGDASQLMAGMSRMRDDMQRWRQRQENNEAEIESVLSVGRSGASSAASRRSRDSGDETLIGGGASTVKEQEVTEAEDRQDQQLDSSPSVPPPVRDSRARTSQHRADFVRPQVLEAAQVDPGASSPGSTDFYQALTGHGEVVELEIQKLEQLQIETNIPATSARSSYESPRQSSQLNVHTKSPDVDITRRIDANGGSASHVIDHYEDESDAEEKRALRQPYLHKYLSGEHFKSPSSQPDFRRSTSRESTEAAESPKASLTAPPPSYADVRSRHSPRSKPDESGPRPKSLHTDPPSTKPGHEYANYVRPSASDTQLVASAHGPAPVHYQPRQVEAEQVIKPAPRQQHQKSAPPPAYDYDRPTRSGVMTRNSFEVPANPMPIPQCTQAPKYPQEPSGYEPAPQPRYRSHYPPVQNEHYNQIYSDEPAFHPTQQQISPKGYEPSPLMSTSMYDFNRPPTHMTVVVDDSPGLHSNLSRSQASLSNQAPGVVQQQRHTIQRTAPSSQPSRMPNSHSVDSGLFQIRAHNQASAVSNPVYAGAGVHEMKRPHPASSQRHWLVDEALRRQQAEHDVQRRHQAEVEAQRRHQAEVEAQRRHEAEVEARRRHQAAEMEAQRRHQAELEAQRRQQEMEARRQAELEAQRRHQVDVEAQRRQQMEIEARRQAELEAQRRRNQQRHYFPPTSEPPPALPPRIKASAAHIAMQRPRPVLNSRAPCTACKQPLGTGDLMTIESLHLSFHLTCFRCIACQTMLGSGRQDADVRVRGSRLYCFNCSALEEGTGGGGGLGRRGGGRY